MAAAALTLGLLSVQPAAASGAHTASTNLGGVMRCVGGPTVYAGVYLSNVPAGTEVVFHNLLDDGSGDSRFTITGQDGSVNVYGPYNQSSWKVMSLGNISNVHGICSA